MISELGKIAGFAILAPTFVTVGYLIVDGMPIYPHYIPMTFLIVLAIVVFFAVLTWGVPWLFGMRFPFQYAMLGSSIFFAGFFVVIVYVGSALQS